MHVSALNTRLEDLSEADDALGVANVELIQHS